MEWQIHACAEDRNWFQLIRIRDVDSEALVAAYACSMLMAHWLPAQSDREIPLRLCAAKDVQALP